VCEDSWQDGFYKDNVRNEKFAYKYALDTIVLIRPRVLSDSFWLGKVVNLGGEPDHVGEYEVWWMESATEFGTWKMSRANRKPLMDWQPEESIQDSVVMVSNEKKLHKKSMKLIRDYMQRWQQDADAVVGDLEPEEMPVEQVLDLD